MKAQQTFIDVPLSWRQLAMLKRFIEDEKRTRATRKHKSSGFHNRLREWASPGRINHEGSTVALSTIAVGRHDDDMTWIANQIIGKKIGGAQSHVFDVFAGAHPRFTGLSIKPRKQR